MNVDNKSNKTKTDAKHYSHSEWDRLKHLIPEVVDSDKDKKSDVIEKGILKCVDGKSTCEDIAKSQKTVSEDGAIFMLLKFEQEGTISCVGPAEKLRDIMFECAETEKYLEFVRQEQKRLIDEVSEKKEQLHSVDAQNREIEDEVTSLKEKIRLAKQDIDKLHKKHEEAIDSANRMIGNKMDVLERKKDVDDTIRLIKEEIVFLNDERSSATSRIKELEGKIDEVLGLDESVLPRLSMYRSVVRGVYKTVRDAQNRSENALKGAPR